MTFSFTDYVNGGELFTHLVQRVRFKEQEVALYSGEIVLALEHLHKVISGFNTIKTSCLFSLKSCGAFQRPALFPSCSSASSIGT